MIKTESIKYIGAKTKLLPYILSIIDNLPNIKTVLDGFAWTTRVWQALKQKGYNIISNDLSEYSKVFWDCYLKNTKDKKYYEAIIKELNNIEGKYGWFSENYGGIDNNGESIQEDGKKKIWQLKNTMKLDSILDYITKNYSWIDLSVLKTSLILAMDKVDSSLWHQVSYLKKWSPRSYKDIKLEVPNFIITWNENNNLIVKEDIKEVVNKYNYDLAYFDSSYWSNNDKMPATRVRYNSYYHIWNSIVLNDKPKTIGKANRRADASDLQGVSAFEEFKKDTNGIFIAENHIKELINDTLWKCSFVIFSYNNNGRVSVDRLNQILKETGWNYITFWIPYKKNVMANMRWNDNWTNFNENYETLSLVEKDNFLNKENLVKIKQDLEKIWNIFIVESNIKI